MSLSLSIEAGDKDKLPITTTEEKAIQRLKRAQWLRAAILGANDGLLSTASLMLGIGAATDDRKSMIISGVAGALAGACSMAVGEFVSVSTQRDIEKSLKLPKCNSDGELCRKLGDTESSVKVQISGNSEASSGTSPVSTTPTRTPLGKLVTCDHETSQGKISPAIQQLQLSPNIVSPSRSAVMKGIVNDHVRLTILHDSSAMQDDGNDDVLLPNPYKAAAASALAFLCGSLVPIVPAMVVRAHTPRIVIMMVVTSIALALFGGLGALLGGSPIRRSAMRVLLGGWISMAITYGLLKNFDRDDKVHGS